MSYLRGKYYTWVGGDCDNDIINLHGDKPSCGCGDHPMVGDDNCPKIPSIDMPLRVFDALVMMRYAEMGVEDKINAVVYALDHGRGNAGCEDLVKRYRAQDYYELAEKYKDYLSISYEMKEKPRPRKHHRRVRHAKKKN